MECRLACRPFAHRLIPLFEQPERCIEDPIEVSKSAIYANHGHYVAEGWSAEPKETFKALDALIAKRKGRTGLKILDVGCATGELIGYLSTQFENGQFVGVDVAKELIETGRTLLPQATFALASALELPVSFDKAFDVVTAIGCMSIFDESEIDCFWDNLFRVCKPGGLIVVLSPLNEYGVDTMIRHRKRLDTSPGQWEAGWNIFSQETIREMVESRDGELQFDHFHIPFDLPQREDPVRTWTLKTEHRDRQLTNGLKLLIDHYFTIVQTAP